MFLYDIFFDIIVWPGNQFTVRRWFFALIFIDYTISWELFFIIVVIFNKILTCLIYSLIFHAFYPLLTVWIVNIINLYHVAKILYVFSWWIRINIRRCAFIVLKPFLSFLFLKLCDLLILLQNLKHFLKYLSSPKINRYSNFLFIIFRYFNIQLSLLLDGRRGGLCFLVFIMKNMIVDVFVNQLIIYFILHFYIIL